MNDHLVRNVLIGAALLIGIAISIGFSFAYFSANIKGNEDAKPLKVEAGTMELTFAEGSDVFDLSNAQPGDSDSKTFSVQNTGTLDDDGYIYNIKLVDVSTSFLENDLKYTIEECVDSECSSIKPSGLKEEGYITTESAKDGEMYIAVNIPRPEKGQFNYYKFTIEFQELDKDQNYNKEAEFSGRINVDVESGALLYKQVNPPELYQGLIPVKFGDNGEIIVANPNSTDWYDYDEKRWANAVLVTDAKYKEITENNQIKSEAIGTQLKLTTDNTSEILQMYVWIPRYKYQLFNVHNLGTDPQEINIKFENGTDSTGDVTCETDPKGKEICRNDANGNWYTHPAFKFGNTDLTGIWVGKFESSGTTSDVKILPDIVPILSTNVYNMFNASRNIEGTSNATKYNLNSEEIDTHMMKNMEWGAMAYLTQSKYGRCTDSVCTEVTLNNKEYKTGYDNTNSLWYTSAGQLASTTGNMYGIYDTNGDAWEYVMGNMVNENGGYYASNSGLASVEEKYYDKYEYDASSWTTHQRGHLGDATRETLQTFGNETGGWYGDNAEFLHATHSWFRRGGRTANGALAGVFTFYRYTGEATAVDSFRVVLTEQD